MLFHFPLFFVETWVKSVRLSETDDQGRQVECDQALISSQYERPDINMSFITGIFDLDTQYIGSPVDESYLCRDVNTHICNFL